MIPTVTKWINIIAKYQKHKLNTHNSWLNVIKEETDVEQHGDIRQPLLRDEDFEFNKFGFNDMCYQDYDECYQLPMPLLFMKDVESFDDNNNNQHPLKWMCQE